MLLRQYSSGQRSTGQAQRKGRPLVLAARLRPSALRHRRVAAQAAPQTPPEPPQSLNGPTRPSAAPSRAAAQPSNIREAPHPGLSFVSIDDVTQESPLPHARATARRRVWTKPYMLLLPDLDGVGVTSKKRWPALATGVELQALNIDAGYQGSFPDLVDSVVAHLESALHDTPPERPTLLLGEGFGGVLALAVMTQCRPELINRLVLVNPITSMKAVPIKRIAPLIAALPANVMQVSPVALLPLLGGSPGDVLNQWLAQARQQGPGAAALSAAQVLLGVIEQLQQLARHLPATTLTARLALLDQGLEYVQERMDDIETRTIILAGGRDYLPSSDEARRLAARLPRAFVKVVADAGHALLLDPKLDLLATLREEGFLVSKRRFSSTIKTGQKVEFGAPGPIELPTPQEVARAGQQLTAPLKQLCSPVFLSTLEDGTIVEGMEGLDTSHRPLLFVGNHQLYALDMNLLVEEIYLQKGILLRGLAHPALFTNTAAARRAATPKASRGADTAPATPLDSAPTRTAMQADSNRQRRNGSSAASTGTDTQRGAVSGQGGTSPQPAPSPVTAPIRLGDLYRTFGAVVVTPTAFFRLLACGECVLLYPGGVREGFKRRDEKYELFWPEKGEFVRMAAKHEAWVVPISAIGWEDSVNIVLDSDEIARHPWLGAAARAASDATPRARDGSTDVDQTFIPPFITPSMPSRLYFLFGRPFKLTKDLASDRQTAEAVYSGIKAAVKDGITWLLERREQDPYKHLLSRLVYENLPVLGKKRAPFFNIASNAAPGPGVRPTTPVSEPSQHTQTPAAAAAAEPSQSTQTPAHHVLRHAAAATPEPSHHAVSPETVVSTPTLDGQHTTIQHTTVPTGDHTLIVEEVSTQGIPLSDVVSGAKERGRERTPA